MTTPTEVTATDVARVDPGSLSTASLVAGINAFGHDLYAQAATGGNVVTSPLSIETAVSMARAGAGGTTAAQIDAAMHLPRISVGSNGKPTMVSDLAQEAVPESLRGACGHPGAQAVLTAVPVPVTVPRAQCDLTGVVVRYGSIGVTVPSVGGVEGIADGIASSSELGANVDPITGDVTFS